MVGKQWFKNVRMTGISSFQLISIVIHIQAILDFQNNLYFQETQQTNATIACHLWKEKNKFFIKRAVFPVKSKLWAAELWYKFGKVKSFIIEQIGIIEFCPLTIILLTTRI